MIKVNGQIIEADKFPDGTLLLKHNPLPYFWNMFGILHHNDHIIWKFDNNEEMIILMFMVNHMRNHGMKEIDLIMPYIPNARQDRVKTKEDVFTLKYFAEFINSLNFSRVIVLDPHSYVSEALIHNIRVENPKNYIDHVVEEIKNRENISEENPLMMFYPDEGAMKRYSGLMDAPYAFGIKKRDWATGQIQGLDVAGMTDKIHNSNILIVDDICSKGGTFHHSAKKLKELGAKKIYLYVSHCENTILEGNLLINDLIEKVYTTDSIFRKEHEKIEVMNYEKYQSDAAY